MDLLVPVVLVVMVKYISLVLLTNPESSMVQAYVVILRISSTHPSGLKIHILLINFRFILPCKKN